jgi:hypothetical protein
MDEKPINSLPSIFIGKKCKELKRNWAAGASWTWHSLPQKIAQYWEKALALL